MWEALTAGPNLPFAVALGLMAVFAVLEFVGMFLGVVPSGVVDSLLPDVDFDLDVDADLDVDTDMDVDVPDSPGFLEAILGWLGVGKVPFLILFMGFLFVFGTIGTAANYIVHEVSGLYVPSLISVVPAFLLSMPMVRWFGRGYAQIIPKEVTEAVSAKSFVGRVATITRGESKRDLPAEAKLRDNFGQMHYVLVEPDLDDDVFAAGTDVVIVRQVGSFYRVIMNTSPGLTKDGNKPAV